MNTIRTMQAMGVCLSLLLGVFISGVNAAEEKGPEFKEACYFGGAGDQGPGDFSRLGLAISEKQIYLAGLDKSVLGGQALAACYALPPGSGSVWKAIWPNQKNTVSWNHEVFAGAAVTSEGLYLAGRSSIVTAQPRTGVVDIEHKAVLVKFPLKGPTGPALGGALWVASPRFFPAEANESFRTVTAVQEGGAPFIYAAGNAQAHGANNTAVLAKFDSAGILLWTKALGNTGYSNNSFGTGVVAHQGFIYVSGTTEYPYGGSMSNTEAALWKVSPSGQVIWGRTFPLKYRLGWTVAEVAASEEGIFLATTRKDSAGASADVQLLKYDEAGNLVWNKTWGSLQDDVALGIAAVSDRFYVVGETRGWMGGGKDAFLLEVDCREGKVISVNYHGGELDDRGISVAVMGKELYIAGDSKSSVGNLGQSEVMLLRYALTKEPPILNASIDIHPGSFPNPVNPKSKGNIPVAILSTAAFDAPALVDRTTLTFGRTGLEKSLKRCAKEDVNGDGRPDLLCHFDTQICAFQMGDTRGVLMGKTLEGRPFVGSDSVVIVPHMKKGDEPKEMKPPTRAPGQIPGDKVKTPGPGGGGGIHGPDKKDGSVVY